MSTVPLAIPSSVSRSSRDAVSRESPRMVNGYSANLSVKVRRCCSANIVVGTKTATWLPDSATLNAARMASSVFPKPTSPQRSRSIGLNC